MPYRMSEERAVKMLGRTRAMVRRILYSASEDTVGNVMLAIVEQEHQRGAEIPRSDLGMRRLVVDALREHGPFARQHRGTGVDQVEVKGGRFRAENRPTRFGNEDLRALSHGETPEAILIGIASVEELTTPLEGSGEFREPLPWNSRRPTHRRGSSRPAVNHFITWG